MQAKVLLWASVLFSLLPAAGARAITGREVMDEVKRLDNSTRKWDDRSLHMTFRISRPGAAERVKELDLYEKRYPEGRKKELVYFLAPPEIRGTSFVQWTDPRKQSQQWLYLPRLKRVRRISARGKGESFAGTDFSYRDLEILDEISNWDEEQAKADLSDEEEIEGVPCYVVEMKPKRDEEAYREIKLWVSKKEFEFHKIELSDPEHGLTKILRLGDFKTIDGISTPVHLQMEDQKKRSQTVVETSNVKYNQNLQDEIFTQRHLEQGHR